MLVTVNRSTSPYSQSPLLTWHPGQYTLPCRASTSEHFVTYSPDKRVLLPVICLLSQCFFKSVHQLASFWCYPTNAYKMSYTKTLVSFGFSHSLQVTAFLLHSMASPDVSSSVIQTSADKKSEQQQQQHTKAGQFLNKQPLLLSIFR